MRYAAGDLDSRAINALPRQGAKFSGTLEAGATQNVLPVAGYVECHGAMDCNGYREILSPINQLATRRSFALCKAE